MRRAVLVAVRAASREGKLISLAEVRTAALALAAESPSAPGDGPPDEAKLTDERLVALLEGHPGVAAFAGIGGETLYHAPDLMSRTYARILDRRGAPTLLMAEEIRANSRDYPRPVPVELFEEQPFGLSRADIETALAGMAASPDFADISFVETPGGAAFLFSQRFLPRPYAQFLAERAESLAENP
jgi:hypothetical protein